MNDTLRCRSCGSALAHTVIDLGVSPLSNAYVRERDLDGPETFYPLTLRVCTDCWLVQIPEFVTPADIFRDYSYFSSYSESWLRHCAAYADVITTRLNLTASSHVVELASNDGYLLQYFVRAGIPVTGVEPAANVAAVALERGIPTVAEFFGTALATVLASQGRSADLVIANNVLAHVPDLNDFLAGIRILLKPGGVLTGEFPHVRSLFEHGEFDTIYHEHFSYFSLLSIEAALARQDLVLFDVETLPTHGGSLRIYARRREDEHIPVESAVARLRDDERRAGYDSLAAYRRFGERVERIKRDLLTFLMTARREGKHVVGYGAPAKATTLLNYCGIRADLLQYTVDRNPVKQGSFIPGVRIPIHRPERIPETRPDYVIILPWNLTTEIMEQLAAVQDWGCRFVVPIPALEIHE